MEISFLIASATLFSFATCLANDGSGYTEGHFTDAFRSSSKELRPSFLLNVETAGTLDHKDAVVSIFGTSSRVSYGPSKNLEARADVGYKHDSNPEGEAYNIGATLKYGVFQKGDFGIAVAGATQKVKMLMDSAASKYLIQVPFTLNAKWVLLTAIPFHGDPVTKGEKNSNGADFGIAVPLGK